MCLILAKQVYTVSLILAPLILAKQVYTMSATLVLDSSVFLRV